jgi:glutamate synthase (NADPH/NADH) large chain
MTNGRALVLGDPGPWICAGMTGGAVYLLLQPEWNFDIGAIKRRIAKGSRVVITTLKPEDATHIRRLLGEYEMEIADSGQPEEAAWIRSLLESDLFSRFVRIIPESQQVEQTISTE